MTLWNLGSINIDRFYRLPHIPQPGETLACSAHSEGLGGKGANMSVAAARAGAQVAHIGRIGPDGHWCTRRLADDGIDIAHIAEGSAPTGHALVMVAADGENSIVIAPEANRRITESALTTALDAAHPGDWFVTQNETNLQTEAAALAKARGLRIAYAAAPFEADAVRAMLPFLDLLVLNEVEAAQLSQHLGQGPGALGVADVIVTRGAEGARHFNVSGDITDSPAPQITPVDTTGAGDTFTGYLLAALDAGRPMAAAIETATQAGALMATRHGTADVIPNHTELDAFIAAQR